MEDKQQILDLLLKALQATRDYCNLVSLDYEMTSPGLELAVATYANGSEKKINITHDSGMAMIHDVVRYLD